MLNFIVRCIFLCVLFGAFCFPLYICSVIIKQERKRIITQLKLRIMITKGTAEYKRAQELANDIKRVAGYNEWRDNSLYNLWCDSFDSFIRKISETNSFGANIAKTVLASIDANEGKRDRSMANVSDKQSWVLATTAIELGISFDC